MTEEARPGVLRLREGTTVGTLDTSASEQEYVVTLATGSLFRLSSRLHDLVECIDGERTVGEIATLLSRKWGRAVGPDQVSDLAQRYLAPYGLLEDGVLPRADAPARRLFYWHRPVLSARRTGPLARIGQHLFTWPAAAIGLGLVVLAHIALYQRAGGVALEMARAIGSGDFLLVYALVLLSVLVHELGHASACRRFGESYGDIGIALYLVFPVFYTDVTRAWRLERGQRVVVDLGGVYFQLLVSAGYTAAYLLTGHPVWLLAVVQIDLLVLLTLNPLIRFDGYWLVSDLLGVPNLGRRMREATRLGGEAAPTGFTAMPRNVKAWLRAYMVALVGTVAVLAWTLIVQAPQIWAHLAEAVSISLATVGQGWRRADWVAVAAGVVRLISPAALLAGGLLFLYGLIPRRRPARAAAEEARKHQGGEPLADFRGA